jgi:hypothetical protein
MMLPQQEHSVNRTSIPSQQAVSQLARSYGGRLKCTGFGVWSAAGGAVSVLRAW